MIKNGSVQRSPLAAIEENMRRWDAVRRLETEGEKEGGRDEGEKGGREIKEEREGGMEKMMMRRINVQQKRREKRWKR